MLDFSKIKKENCWSKEKALSWQKNMPYLIGMNYVPQTSINSTEMWQHETFDEKTIDKELGWAHSYGYNSIRIFLPYIVYEREKQDFIERIKVFLNIAKKHQILVMPSIFDDCAFSKLLPSYGKQRQPLKGIHNSGWTASPGANMVEDKNCFSKLKDYVVDVISAFKEDKRIIMWDLYNESGNNNSGKKSYDLLKKTFEWAREVNPIQPLTACVWMGESDDATEEQKFMDSFCYANSDIITFHCYASLDRIKRYMGNICSSGYPVVCTEWMARVGFECFIPEVLPFFSKNNISSFHWGFVNGKTQTNLPWEWNESKGEPEMWFHDVLHKDGTPYIEEEMNVIKKISQEHGIS